MHHLRKQEPPPMSSSEAVSVVKERLESCYIHEEHRQRIGLGLLSLQLPPRRTELVKTTCS